MLLIAIGFIFLDQLSKWLAVIFLQGNAPIRAIPYLFNLTFTTNTGAAWGMLSDKRWIFLVVSSIAILALLLFILIKRPREKLLCWSLTLLLAGGIGNMIDRVLLGYVVDFIEFGFVEFPVFNVADSCVSIGAVLLILYMVISIIKENKQNARTDGNNINGDEGDRGSST